MAYAIPSVFVWGMLGFAVQLLYSKVLIVLLVTCCYVIGFGICEVLNIPFHQLSFSWQVPHQWLDGLSDSIQTLIWGVCLGPGIMTRNPYAGIWMLPLLLALAPNRITALILGVAIGFTHGCSRSIGVLRNRNRLEDTCIPIIVLEQMRWKFWDGCVMLLVAGGLIMYIIMSIKDELRMF